MEEQPPIEQWEEGFEELRKAERQVERDRQRLEEQREDLEQRKREMLSLTAKPYKDYVADRTAAEARGKPLTTTENDVCFLCEVLGWSNADIAAKLGLSPGSVGVHKSIGKGKLNRRDVPKVHVSFKSKMEIYPLGQSYRGTVHDIYPIVFAERLVETFAEVLNKPLSIESALKFFGKTGVMEDYILGRPDYDLMFQLLRDAEHASRPTHDWAEANPDLHHARNLALVDLEEPIMNLRSKGGLGAPQLDPKDTPTEVEKVGEALDAMQKFLKLYEDHKEIIQEPLAETYRGVEQILRHRLKRINSPQP